MPLDVDPNPDGWWGFDPGFNSDDWKEAVAMYSPSQLAVGRKRSYATLTGYVPFERLTGAIVYLLGFSYVNTQLGFPVLSRQVPATHPWLPSLFATEIVECVGAKFISKVAAPHKWSLPYAKYTLAKITVAYSQPPYKILADADIDMSNDQAYIGQELRRWCYWAPKPRYEMLELPGGMLRFDAPNKSFDGAQFISPRQVYRMEKQTRKLVWHNVPEEFVMNSFGFMPKLDKAIGKINKEPFFADSAAPPGTDGCTHTWLLDDVDTVNSEVYVDPIASSAFKELTRRLDIVFTLIHFNPPRGRPESNEAGWRLNLAADGKWYPGKYSFQFLGVGIESPQDIPFETSFQKLFTHWSQ